LRKSRLGRSGCIAVLPPQLARPQRALFARWRRELACGATRIGWKVGHDIQEVQSLVGDQPVIGCLTSRTLVKTGGEWCRCGEDLRAETEFAVEVGTELAAGAAPATAVAAISGLRVALEIVDLAYPSGDLDAIIDGNVFHRAVAFGPMQTVERAELGRATLHLDEAVHEARELVPEPVWVVRTVADVLGQFGETLLPGDRILSGSFVHQPLDAAKSVSAAIENLGRASLSIRPAVM
jgi:2-keto-4-pentenoate hydratase